MAAVDLFDLLQDFGARPLRLPAAMAEPRPVASAETPPPSTGRRPIPSEDVRAEIAKAEAALEERLTLAHNAALDALKQAHADRTGGHARRASASRPARPSPPGSTRWRAASASSRPRRRHASSAAFLSDELQKRSIESLAQSIRAAVTDREAVRIEVRGPQSLFADA